MTLAIAGPRNDARQCHRRLGYSAFGRGRKRAWLWRLFSVWRRYSPWSTWSPSRSSQRATSLPRTRCSSPSHPTTANYIAAWSQNSFSSFFLNSLVVALGTVLITVVVASLAAFAFARYRFPFKEVIFYLFLAALAVPSVELIIPQYLLMLRLHLVNSLPGLVLIYASENLPFSIFLLRGFFEAVPKDLEESFRLDGASTLRVLTRLIAPLSAPALAVVAMFTFNFAWEEFIVALTLLNSQSHYTLPIALQFFITAHQTDWGPLFAACTIATIPSVIVYFISQRWFQRGVSLGGIR